MSRSTAYLMVAIIVTLATLGAIGLAAATQEDRLAHWMRIEHAQSVENGAELYQINCASCHGNSGAGTGELGPALNDRPFFTDRLKELGWNATLEEYISAVIANGRVTATRPLYAGDGVVAMNAWHRDYGGPLRPDEIDDLTAFVMNWRPTALGEVTLEELALPPAEAGDPEEGEQIYLAAGCSKCHAVEGLNDASGGPDLTHIAAVAAGRVEEYSADAYLRESFLIPDAYVVEGYKPNSGCGGVLSEAQLDDLIAFLLTLE